MGNKKNRLIIRSRLLDLNKYTNENRTNKYIAANTKKHTLINVGIECLSQKKRGLCIIDGDALYDLKLYWILPNNKKDPDNIMSEIKFLLDGVVSAKIIDKDGRKNIRHISHYIRTIKNQEFVIIRFIKIKK